MKITGVETLLVRMGNRPLLFVAVDTDEGLTGVGEASLTSRELAVSGFIEHLRPLLVGQDPARIEHLWQTMFRGGFFPANRVGAAAIAAIDIALWDIRGKALGVPCYDLLGGRVRDRVVCYAHCVETDGVESLVAACRDRVAEGWKFVRWGLDMPAPGEDGLMEPRVAMRHAIRQFEAVRGALGDDVELCFDVHTRLDPAEAVALCRELEQYRPFFVEDPLRVEDVNAYAMLRTRTGVPIAAGEHLASKWDFRPLIEGDLIDYARLDPALGGGITEAHKIAGWCEVHHINLALHMAAGPVLTAACLHLDLACPNVGVQELAFVPGAGLTDIFPQQVRWEDGYLLPPTGPGLGIAFDREAARAHTAAFQPAELPHLHRRDGSFTNW